MPRLGEAVEEATITKWLKSEGDLVEEFDPMVEVNTDKVDTEIPSPVSGTLLKIVVPEEGSVVEVGTVLAWIGEPGETIPDLGTAATEGKTSENQAMGGASEGAQNRIETPSPNGNKEYRKRSSFISPIVAKIAAENNIDLQKVRGTGLNHRITKKDILNFLKKRGEPESHPAHLPDGPTRAAGVRATSGSIIPHSTMRRNIAKHMQMSRRTSPHVTTVFEANMSKIVEHRSIQKDIFSKSGVNLTFTTYFIAASAVALRAYPIVNSSWSDEGLILHPDIDIGMAASLGEDGLIVPVIKNADDLSLLGIARSVNNLTIRARSRQLQVEEVTGGTFTITNHGVSGSLFALPIINQPQCAILGVGKIQKRVIVLEDISGYDTIAVRPMAYLTLTFDHRILDGAIADAFLSKVVTTLENWT
jgi:2-oxoglutarate dehydrogenase E2 component (dihydrolipoamide succinyltransferase)